MKDEALILGVVGAIAWWQGMYFLGLVTLSVACLTLIHSLQSE